jgi:flagellar assembly protein FliH
MDGFAGRLLLFVEDFDAAAHGAPPPREPDDRDDEIARLHARLAEARDEAYADGIAAGLAQAQAQHRDDVRRALGSIADGIADARQASIDAAEHAAHDVAHLLLASLGAVMPELLRRHGDAEAAAVVRSLLPALLLHEPAVTIRCGPHTVPAVQAELAALEDDLVSAVRLVPADDLPPGDVRLSWPDGRARRSIRELWAAVAAALAPLLVLPPLPKDLATAHHTTAPDAAPPESAPPKTTRRDKPRRARTINPPRKSSR